MDSHTEYGGVVNFKEYLQEEREWLSTLKPSNKTYNLLIYHIPDLSDMNDSWFSFVSEINSLGMQFGICGHYHDTIWKASGSYGLNFPQLVMGGDPYTGDVTCAMLKFTGGNSLNISVISQKGTNKLSKTISLSRTKASAVTYTAPLHGLNMQTTLTTLSLSFLFQPVVFETGDEDYYTVCWVTNVETLSYIEYKYQGTLYQIHDEIGGERRTFDKLHSVKVLKEHLNNNVYRIGAVQCTRHDPNHHARGNSCVSNYYVFENRNEGAAVKLYNLPNITAESALTSMSAAIKELGTSPALIIANGDIRSSIYNEDSIVNFLSALAGALESSTVVECYTDVEIFSRGTVKGSKLGGIAGMSSGSTIQRCANFGTVSTDWIEYPYIGGLVGQVCTKTATNIINSYNRGDVIVGADQADNAANSSVGGLVGHIGSASIVVTNCYNTAETVSYTDLGAGIAGEISSAGAHTFTNCYYLSGNANKQTAFSSGTNDWSSTAGSGTISSKSASAMKSASFATTLNSSAFTYDASANDGYPTHAAYLAFDMSGGVYSITVDETLGVYISGGILYGVSAGDSADEIRTKIENTSGITVNGTGTGATVTLTVDGYIVDTVTLVVIGDLDGDGRITSADYNNVIFRFVIF